jgi:hypothetical protein
VQNTTELQQVIAMMFQQQQQGQQLLLLPQIEDTKNEDEIRVAHMCSRGRTGLSQLGFCLPGLGPVLDLFSPVYSLFFRGQLFY